MSNCVEVRGIKIGEGIPKICVPIIGKTKAEILSAASKFEDAAFDLVEWRADWFEGVLDFAQVYEVLRLLRYELGEVPILFTFRSSKEGGERCIDTDTYVGINKKVAATGLADLIDIELFTGDDIVKDVIGLAHVNDVKVIVSNHDFHKTPAKEELIGRLCKMQDLGADISKIAVMPQSKRDVLVLLETTYEMSEEYAKCPIVTMSMAGTGLLSRLCGEVFGSALTFGAIGKASAPGQMDAADLKEVLEIIHKSI